VRGPRNYQQDAAGANDAIPAAIGGLPGIATTTSP